MTTQLHVLFVCTANISRSPYAERRAAGLLSGCPGIEVGSAGVPGHPGRPMDPLLAAILDEDGIPHEDHVSRCLTADLLADADLVLTFEFAQQLRILDAWPEHAAKVFGMNQYAAGAPVNSMTLDIADPYGRGRRAARRAAAEIDDALARMLPRLLGAGPAAG